MKYYNNTNNINFKWEQVSKAIFLRYPNPWSKHVYSEDTISRTVEGPILKTVRLLTKNTAVKAPQFMGRFVPTGPVCIVEESHIDAMKKTIITYTRNTAFNHIANVVERCEFSLSKDNKNKTLVKREAWVISNVYGLSKAIEMFFFDRYKSQVKKSLKGLEYILNKMYVPEKILSMDLSHSLSRTVPLAHRI
ncbi:PRELI domain-containing protein 1, mitochondrial isoform X1 [Hydra vulgaris]|uniref:PRELI domain-containing protein 1, mitochondrial isoform X1 n=1 Tax=Hydra vulgaris TaxID=6087 RepID=UPI000640EA74|nr:PRELI domain-containing protein 1, mitochondrial [Hydra vulgaris]